MKRLHRLSRDARKRAAPPGVRPGYDAAPCIEEEERKAICVIRHDRLAGNVGRKRVGVKDALPTFRLPPVEGHDIGPVLLDGHEGPGEIEAQLVSEPLAPRHHQLGIGRPGEAHRAERPGAEPVVGRKPGDADDGGELQGGDGVSLAFRA